MREQLYISNSLSGFFRFTPACAGTTDAYRFSKIYYEVHPRMCGNNMYQKIKLLFLKVHPRMCGNNV